MKILTKDLTGAGLAYTVAVIEGWRPFVKKILITNKPPVYVLACRDRQVCVPLGWSEAGPIIDREKIGHRFWPHPVTPENGYWFAWIRFIGTERSGPTPIIAAMRCWVASKLGAEVEVPDELVAA